MPTIVLMIVILAVGHIGANAEKLDVAIFADSSTSICPAQPCKNWGDILQLFCDIVDSLTIGPDNSRVALILVSDQARVLWDFNKYTDKNALLSAIRNVVFPGGVLTKQITMDFVLTNVFSLTAGERSDARNVLIGITDGASNIVDLTPSYLAAIAVQNAGVKILVICVTKDCPESLAQRVASPPKKANETYFVLPQYSSLKSITKKLVEQILAS